MLSALKLTLIDELPWTLLWVAMLAFTALSYAVDGEETLVYALAFLAVHTNLTHWVVKQYCFTKWCNK